MSIFKMSYLAQIKILFTYPFITVLKIHPFQHGPLKMWFSSYMCIHFNNLKIKDLMMSHLGHI